MNPQCWQAAAAQIIVAYAVFLGGLYAFVTVPLKRGIRRVFHPTVESRLTRLEAKLNEHGERITRLEERRFK